MSFSLCCFSRRLNSSSLCPVPFLPERLLVIEPFSMATTSVAITPLAGDANPDSGSKNGGSALVPPVMTGVCGGTGKIEGEDGGVPVGSKRDGAESVEDSEKKQN